MSKFLQFELIWVILLSPSIIVPEYFWDEWAYPWAILALFLFWPLRLLSEKRLAPSCPLHWPILGLFAWVLLSFGSSILTPLAVPSIINDSAAIQAIGILCVGVALYFSFVNFGYFQTMPLLAVVALSLIGIGLAAIGPALLLAFPSKMFVIYEELRNTKPISLFGATETINPNILAGSILLPLPLALALSLRWDWTKQRWLPLLFGLAGLLMLLTLVLTQSRGSYVAIVIALVTLLSIRWRWTLLVIMIMFIAVVATLGWDGLMQFASAIGSDGSITSLSGRWEIWVGSFNTLLSYPLFGIGFGAFHSIMPGLFSNSKIFQSPDVTHAHNLLLQVGLDLGVPGLVLYLWVWICAIAIQVRLLRLGNEVAVEGTHSSMTRHQRQWLHQQKRKSLLSTTLAAGLLTATVAMFLHGLVDAATWGTKPAFVPFLLLAITALLYIKADNDTLNEE